MLFVNLEVAKGSMSTGNKLQLDKNMKVFAMNGVQSGSTTISYYITNIQRG